MMVRKIQIDGKITLKTTLEDLLNYLKECGIDYSSYKSNWNGHVYVRPDVDYVDDKKVRSLKFEFMSHDNKSKLMHCEYETQSDLGIWITKYRTDLELPWYKGGNWL